MTSLTRIKILAITLVAGVTLGGTRPVAGQVTMGRDGTEQTQSLEDAMKKEGVYVNGIVRDATGNAVLALRFRSKTCRPGLVEFCELHNKDVRTDAEAMKRIMCFIPRQFDVCGIGRSF